MKPVAIDLFSGCGGLTLGLKRAGFRVIGAVEIDPLAIETYRANHKRIVTWPQDICTLPVVQVMRRLKLRPGQLDLLAGCPPCQGFSTMTTLNGRLERDDPRNDLVFEFVRFVRGLRPKAVMMENVPGLAKDKRIRQVVAAMRAMGYHCTRDVLDAANYGVPQRRRRFILVAGRGGEIPFGQPARRKRSVREALGKLGKRARLDPLHNFPERRTERVKRIIRLVPRNGGSRLDLGPRSQLECHRKCDGFKDVYGRMAWDDVAPTITGGCFNPSKGRFLHPVRHRTITLREAALLQTFPPSYFFSLRRGKSHAAQMIGNALPPEFISCMYPFAEQLIAYQAHDRGKRIGGLVLEVKGDFCHKVRDILQRYRREGDYVEVSLDSEYRYNPLHNDLDAHALAYNIASLLNNLFGKGKEPFWQQAYTNLVKFIILLHKVAFDYVTLFDVYHCAISPELLQQRIEQAEELLFDKHFVFIPKATYEEHIQVLIDFDFLPDEAKDRDQYRAPATLALEQHLKKHAIEFREKTVPAPEKSEPDNRAQLEAVKRWFYDDWLRIEPKLRTSIVEGISVFLSLFDDNPKVKRVFCPPKECYDKEANADGKYGKPLPSFSWLIETGRVCALNFPIGMNPGLAKAIGAMMKLDFERAVLNRVPQIEAHPW